MGEKMNSASQNPNLGEAASSFLAGLPAEEGEKSQQAVYGFVRWYGGKRSLTELTAHEVENYAARLSSSQANYLTNVDQVKAFLAYAKKRGWSKTNLAAHLKTKKAKTMLTSSARRRATATPLTQHGYARLEAEIARLKKRRLEVIEEMRLAAADKDFRENAPLDAAREEKGHLEGRIMELEETLKSATIIDETKKTGLKVSVGDSVILIDPASGEELHYVIVSPREVDPVKGRISSNSPIGKAVIGCAQGETVEITAPLGKLCYQIKQVERK
jgi:transcription elongation factor GreA